MNQRPSEFNYTTNVDERTITFLNPPNMSSTRYPRWQRDLGERIQFFSIGYGYTQNEDNWVAKYNLEEYISVIRFLEFFGWNKQI